MNYTDTVLKGLPGLNRLSEEERQKFFADNEEKLKKYAHLSPELYMQQADIIYNNQRFRDVFGEEEFQKYNKNGIQGYNLRNQLLIDKVVTDAFSSKYNPVNAEGIRDNSKGLGSDFEKYYGYKDPLTGERIGGMSTDALQKVLESDYLSPEEFENDWNRKVKSNEEAARQQPLNQGIYGATMPMSLNQQLISTEGQKQLAREKNQRILDEIYNNEADSKAAALGNIVSQAYQDSSIVGRTDEETLELFKKAIMPSIVDGNMGISEYASHYGMVEGEKIAPEMENFTIDEMRQVLAKKAVYDHYMTPDMAATALNNEAKRYMTAHQSTGRKAELFAKDVAIAATSYSMDKLNGFYSVGLMAADAVGDNPRVYVDDRGEILALNDKRLVSDSQGRKGYQDEDGKFHYVYEREMSRTALHNIGKSVGFQDAAGSDDNTWFNPQDWTRREQFGVWDKDLAKEYEKLGSSPYKVAYNPNDDRDLLYESFKMMSFGLADAGSQLIPFGIGVIGDMASTAKYIGRLGRAVGDFTKFTSRMLGNMYVQGTAGAAGIAYAYQRGSFPESLMQNLSNLEENVQTTSWNEVQDLYQNDGNYRKELDAEIAAYASNRKDYYRKTLGDRLFKDRFVNEEELDRVARKEAEEAVIKNRVNQRIAEKKSSGEYGDMVTEAINSANQVATVTFWPEAIKYGLVNAFGHRRFLYSRPTSLTQKAQRTFEGMREMTTSAGRKRLATDIGKTVTNAEKWKNLGKVVGSQVWGGAWTNGTDDMMVDAAERINEDSYRRYLHDYETGESTADLYNPLDGLFSYWLGLNNSLGQQTTREAAIVGAGGGLVSANIHFANIASLATKSGRDVYRNNFLQRYKRDADGMIEKDAEGNPIIEKIGWRENWRDRVGFFLQNGVLNTYYGKKQQLRDLQSHADYVNAILDKQDDFNLIRDLVASNIGVENAVDVKDEKTMRFINAFNAMGALEVLGNSKNDPTTLSSVVRDRKTLIERTSVLGTGRQHDFTDDELANLVAQYYSVNSVPQSNQNNQIALENIGRNARKLQEAYKAYNEAEEHIQEMEKSIGHDIVPIVRNRMKLSLALDSHWKERVSTMKEEIGDTTSDNEPAIGAALIATYGGRNNAEKVLKASALAETKLVNEVNVKIDNVNTALNIYNEAQKNLREASTSDERFLAQIALKQAKDAYDDAVESRMLAEDMLSKFRKNKEALEKAVSETAADNEKAVLSSDEIMNLDARTRARMMNPKNRDKYGREQRAEIEKLEGQLKRKDPNALQKIQDIAALSYNIAQNEDAFNRISRNPDAAALQMEMLNEKAARKAYDEINRRNADDLMKYIRQVVDSTIGRDDVSQDGRKDYVFKTLRVMNPTLLDLIDKDGLLLDDYRQEIKQAKEFAKVLADINAVIDNLGLDQDLEEIFRKKLNDVVEPAKDKAEIMTNLEAAIDTSNEPQLQQGLEDLLKGMVELDYTRDATVIENRKKRKEREEKIRQKEEEDRRQEEERARKAAEEFEKQKMAQTERKKEEARNGGNGVEEVELKFEEEEKAEEVKPEEKQPESNIIEGHNDEIGDYVEVNTPAVEQQVQQDGLEDKTEFLEDLEDVDMVNEKTQEDNDTNPALLSGSPMGEWVIDKENENTKNERYGNPKRYEHDLFNDGVLVHKEGNKGNPDDSMERYFTWMENEGIRLDSIVSDELPKILAKNPHAKVRFMRVIPSSNATHDNYMKSHTMLVLDYDDRENKDITKIHNKDNGGVITSGNRKYLIIGEVGYGRDRNSPRFEKWRRITDAYYMHKIPARAWEWFSRGGNQAERFYVYPDFYTEIPPGAMVPGSLVKQTGADKDQPLRRISELIGDKSRNPHNLNWNTLAWLIQERMGKYVTFNTRGRAVMAPRNREANAGRVFVLVPAGNGKLLTAKVEPLFYNDGKFNSNSQLYQEVQDLLGGLMGDYNSKMKALTGLFQIFHMSEDGHNILLAKDGNAITFVKQTPSGPWRKTIFTKAQNFSFKTVLDAFEEWNPRINITPRVLSKASELEKYDEAGALMVDIAKLGVAGVSFSIYPIDSKGNMEKPADVNWVPSRRDYGSEYVDENRLEVYSYGTRYNYNRNTGEYFLNGVKVEDARTISELEYARRIYENGLLPVKSEDAWDYYILESGEKPEVIGRNERQKKTKVLDKESADKLIKEVEAKKAAEERRQNMQEEAQVPEQTDNWEEVELTGTENDRTVPANDNASAFDEQAPTVEERKKESTASVVSTDNSSISPKEVPFKSPVQSFSKTMRGSGRDILLDAIMAKAKADATWADVPTNSVRELEKYLRSKGVNLESIPTDRNELDAWVHREIVCR